MSILRNPNRHRYTVIDSAALEDTAISFEAKGVLAYLLSKPDGWLIHQEHLSRVGGIGRHKIMRIFSELRQAGYIAYKKPRNEFGQVEGTEIVLCETPCRAVAKPECGINRESENPTLGKPDPLVNLDLSVNLEEEKEPNTDLKDIAQPKNTVEPKTTLTKAKVNPGGTRLPPDWVLSQALGEWALAEGLTRERIRQEADKFRDYWISKPGAAGRKADWPATWRNWIRKATGETGGGGVRSVRGNSLADSLTDTSWAR